MKETEQYKTVITADHKLFDLHIKETFEYRDLIFLFVRREFVSKYKQTILGPVWAIVQPLLTTVVFTIIFGNLAKLTTADIEGDFLIPSFLFYMIGNICWSYFASTLTATSNTFIGNASIMGKVYYPRMVMPISTAFSNLISFAIQLTIFLAIYFAYLFLGNTSLQLTPKIILVPVYIVQLMILSVGFGIIISSVTTKYRDLAMLVSFGLQLWQYASPVAYGLQLIPSKYISLYMINPITPIITSMRYAFFGFGYFNITFYFISWLISLLVLIIGLIMFNKIERTFMDTI